MSKKNSIKEDIKSLESFLYAIETFGTIDDRCIGNLYKPINHILSDYKRVLKENEKLTYARNWYFENTVNKICNPEMLNKILKEDYIPVQKIKDKIEEFDIAILECEYSDDDDEEYKKAVEKDKLCLLNQKRALQELLEKE